MKMPRTVLQINEIVPGTEIAAETSTAMVASSIVFRSVGQAYARRLLNKAKSLFKFVKKHKGIHDGECPLYCSFSGYHDEHVKLDLGQDRPRTSWATYYRGTHAVIVVIDSVDIARITIMKEELFRLLSHDDLQNSVILVFANKQDLKDAMTLAEITDTLLLHSIKTHDWHIQACSALTGDGLNDGLGWIA
ncbi:ADP-ribosylation factor-like protein 5 [Hibiscus syriacus]|uniref:cellulase n=1 Tax=Hibiscus syriacus TaxID=106335 RepID=A0A6A3CPW6_HIBSY|nr:ADP-ribosylation factor-like protein 5 [Hibiscus syriacus]